jgi:hypothetical protein
MGLVAGTPDWQLVKCAHLLELPTIRWKLLNLAKLKKSNPHKFSHQFAQLRTRFAV